MNKALIDKIINNQPISDELAEQLTAEIQAVAKEAENLPSSGELPQDWQEYLDRLELCLMIPSMPSSIFEEIDVLLDADERIEEMIGDIASGIDLASTAPPVGSPDFERLEKQAIANIKRGNQ